jgi:hypothetical protein
MRILRMIIILIASVLVLAGCGRGLNAFKELGVTNKDIPSYELSSEITDQTPPTKIWATVDTKNIDENQAKQIMADYIDKKLKESGKSLQGIYFIVKDRKVQYTAVYAKDENTLKTLEPKAPKPEKFPSIVYIKTS